MMVSQSQPSIWRTCGSPNEWLPSRFAFDNNSARRAVVNRIMSVMNDASPTRPPITESPWYWVYLFCTAGLIALLLAGPKFSARQAQIERKYESRQHAAQHVAGRVSEEADVVNPREGTRITLRPLYITLGTALGVAWVGLWWRHYRFSPTRSQPASVTKVTE